MPAAKEIDMVAAELDSTEGSSYWRRFHFIPVFETSRVFLNTFARRGTSSNVVCVFIYLFLAPPLCNYFYSILFFSE